MGSYIPSAQGACMTRLIGYMAILCLLATMVGCGGVTSTGTLAYISNSQGSGFTVFNVNTDGTLTLSDISPQNTPASPKVIQFAPNGKWAYFLDQGGTTIYGFTRAGNGTLPTQIGQFYTGPGASSLVIAAGSNFIYVALPNTNMLAIYSIDQTTGILSQVGSNVVIGYAVQQLVMSPGGNLLFGLAPSSQTVLSWTLNPSSGVATGPTTLPVGLDPSYLVLSANGAYAYVLDHQSVTNVPANGSTLAYSTPNIFGFNVLSSGVLDPMPDSPFNENADVNGIYPTNPVAGATSHDNRFLFVANAGTHNVSVFQIASTSGAQGELTEVLGSKTTINGVPVSTASPFDCGYTVKPVACTTPSFVTVSNANNALYIIDAGTQGSTGRIFQYQINQNTGSIRAQNPTSVSAGGGPAWITIR
jgi:6-phosphogluconolactonase (cycloisomerase 2 family)